MPRAFLLSLLQFKVIFEPFLGPNILCNSVSFLISIMVFAILFFRTLADYIMWKVVNQKYIYLSSEYTELFKSFYLQAFNYWRDSDQHQLCLLTTSVKFGIPLAKVFLDQKFFGDSKKSV